MADNIKIIGNIIDTTTISRYDEKDVNLIASRQLQEYFGGEGDYIEYYLYDAGGNLLEVNYNYLDYKLPSSLGLKPGTNTPPNTTGNIPINNVGVVSTLSTPTSSLYPSIEIDPIMDIQNTGYSSGEFVPTYNFFHNVLSNNIDRALFVKEISFDRTEIRLASTTLTNDEIEKVATEMIDEINNSSYYVDYLLNFGDNKQYIAVNVALNKTVEGYEILFKLYQPLPSDIQEKDTLWVVSEKVNSYSFDINLDKLVIPPPPPTLRGPNFDISILNTGTKSTSYTNYQSAVNNLLSLQSSSYNQIQNLLNTQSIQINVDYAVSESNDFGNFVFFGSAEARLNNFYTKVKQIEDYNTLISTYTPSISTTPSLITEINKYSASINTIVSQFDGFESYLYFESSSYSWPKSGYTKPFSLLSTGSATVLTWYNNLILSAQYYDENNYNNLIYATPDFIKEDPLNLPYLTFLNMIGQYFDNIWIYLKAITDINLANNNLNYGISKDLVYEQLKSLGIKLYSSQAGEALDSFLIGANTGSTLWNNDFSPTSSYLNNIPRKDLVSELYKRIYHNLPLLLKTKGTVTGLNYLMTVFGIPNQTYYTVGSGSFYTPTGSAVTASILNVKEYGGGLKSSLIDGYNNDKVRIVNNSIVDNILSPIANFQSYPIDSNEFRENDMHYVDVSFSPQTQINTYISGAISSSNATWSLDDYIGDPRYLYSSSYIPLDTERTKYYKAGVSGYSGFTSSYLDYNGFIRLIEFFDNSLFKMLNDFVPERTSLSTGVTFESPVLERNKVVYANPTTTATQSLYTAEYSSSGISSEYGHFYDALGDDKKAWYDGNISGSYIDVYDYFENSNPNPYVLADSSIFTPQAINEFNHSDFNILFNNVSQSIFSIKRQGIEYNPNSTSSILYKPELQDSYLTLQSYNNSRYNGTKITSLLYNNYTSASYTGSDGVSIQMGDISYGKNAVINHNSYKIGWVKNIQSQSLNFNDKTQISLKYLIDSKQSLTNLSRKNDNLFEVQNTFKSGDQVIISLSDSEKPSFQKTLDGSKTIFRGGFSFDPILYRERTEKLYFRWTDPNNPSYYVNVGLKGWDKRNYTYEWDQSLYTSTTPTPDPTLSPNNVDVNSVYKWYIKDNWTLSTRQEQSDPISIGLFNPSYPQISSLISINNSYPSNFTLSNPPPTLTQRYVFNFLLFNQYTKNGGYNNEIEDVTEQGSQLYKVPRTSTYVIKGQIPVKMEFKTNYYEDYTSTTTYSSNQGNFKVYGVVEKSSNGGIDWTYVASTKLDYVKIVSSGGGSRTTGLNFGPNVLYSNTYNAFSVPKTTIPATTNLGVTTVGDTPTISIEMTCKIKEDSSTPTLNNPNPLDQVITDLNAGDLLRLNFYILDTHRLLFYTTNVIKNFITFGTDNWTTAPLNHPLSFFEIYDQDTVTYDENLTTEVSSSTVFSTQASGSILSFTPEMTNIIMSGSIFLPEKMETTTPKYYSPVIDECTIEPFDLIRIGSFNSPSPEYYTILTSSIGYPPPSVSPNSIVVNAGYISSMNWSQFTTLTNDNRSTIVFDYNVNVYNFFNTIIRSTNKTFTVTYDTIINGVATTNNKTFTLQVYPTISPTKYYIKKYNNRIYIAVSTNVSSTITSNAGIDNTVNPPVLDSNGGISSTFVYASDIFSTGLNVSVDSNFLKSVNGSDFAILRPKPDETSVVVNYKKNTGDVSQTILIPIDASDEIKSKVGDIFKNINVDLTTTQ